MKLSNEINRGIIIRTGKMPVDDEEKLKNYIEEYKQIIGRLQDLLESSNCENIHLFFAGPLALLPFMIPGFVNHRKVIQYHYDSDRRKYYTVGVIEK